MPNKRLQILKWLVALMVTLGIAAAVVHRSQHVDLGDSHDSKCQLCLVYSELTSAVGSSPATVNLLIAAASLLFVTFFYKNPFISPRRHLFPSSLDPPFGL